MYPQSIFHQRVRVRLGNFHPSLSSYTDQAWWEGSRGKGSLNPQAALPIPRTPCLSQREKGSLNPHAALPIPRTRTREASIHWQLYLPLAHQALSDKLHSIYQRLIHREEGSFNPGQGKLISIGSFTSSLYTWHQEMGPKALLDPRVWVRLG